VIWRPRSPTLCSSTNRRASADVVKRSGPAIASAAFQSRPRRRADGLRGANAITRPALGRYDRRDRDVAFAIARCPPVHQEEESSLCPFRRDRVPSSKAIPVSNLECPTRVKTAPACRCRLLCPVRRGGDRGQRWRSRSCCPASKRPGVRAHPTRSSPRPRCYGCAANRSSTVGAAGNHGSRLTTMLGSNH
jgi:hypothetical protein